MRRFLLCIILFLFLLSGCVQSFAAAEPTIPASAATKTPVPPTSTPKPTVTPLPILTLHRGLNMGNMLEVRSEGNGGRSVQEEYFVLIKQAGFDFVRLPVGWNAHAEVAAPYTIDPKFFAQVDQVLTWALKSKLTVILDFHNYEAMMSDPRGNKDRFLGIWKQIAEHYRDDPATVFFELLNEPNTTLDASLWNEYAADALKVIREMNPTRDIVIGPTMWNSFGSISTLDIPNDPHVIATFHYYEPFHFTHQGAEWEAGSNAWMGTTWDGTPEQKAEITSNFAAVADWAKRHDHLRILLGEFGAYSKAPQDSRVRWTTFVREQAEAHGFAWSYWEFNAGFGVYDPNANVWRDDLLKALIP